MNKSMMIKLFSILMIISYTFLPNVLVAGAVTPWEDGEYRANFTFLKDGTDSVSVMDGYTEKPAMVHIINGQPSVEITLKNSDWIKVFQYDENGIFKDAEVVSEDQENDTRIVRFPMNDLDNKLDVYTHVVVPFINYDNKYTVQFTLDTGSMELITSADSEINDQEENGGEQGTENETVDNEDADSEPSNGSDSDDSNGDNIDVEEEGDNAQGQDEGSTSDQEEESNPDNDQSEVGEQEEPSVEQPNEQKPFTLEDGQYTINLSTLHATENKPSAMEKYLQESAKLTVECNQAYLELTIQEKPGQFLTDVRLAFQNNFYSGIVLEEEQENLSRTVKYEIDNLATVIDAEVDMHVVAANYSNTQKFRIQLDHESIQQIDDNNDKEVQDDNLELGTYTIEFDIHKDGTEETSVMDGYIQKPAILNVTEKDIFLDLTLTNSDWIKLLQYKQLKEFIDAEVVSEDKEADTRVVRITLEQLDQPIDLYTHVVIPTLNYDNYYTVQLLLNLDSLTAVEGTPEEPEVPSEETPQPEEPEQPGESDNDDTVTSEPENDELDTNEPNSNHPGEEAGGDNENQDQAEPVDDNDQQPGENDELQDGTYQIDFSVFKDGTEEVSVMDEYTLKPAMLTVKEGEKWVTITLTHSDWIKVLQTKQDGKYKDVEIIQVDAEADTRQVRFKVEDLDELVYAYTEVYFEEPFLYDSQYYVQFKFDPSTITKVTGGSGSTSEEEETKTGNQTQSEIDGNKNNSEQKGNSESSNGDGLHFDRTNESVENSDTDVKAKNVIKNAKTADTAKIGLLLLLLVISGGWLVRKIRLGNI